MSTQTVTVTLGSGDATLKMVMESCRWPQGTDTRVTGSVERRTAKVIMGDILGKYCFTNGDIYEGNFKNGNR